ncbi:PEGA domain-containing protein [Chondromyces apiculatus]|nr:PEGA domain-containing protein [Chondromyces apiculatus]
MILRRSLVRSIAVALSLGVAVTSGPVLAQEGGQPSKAAVEEAKQRFQRGRELYEENDFQGALVEIRRAYDLAPTYRLLFDIGQIYYQLQDYPNALKTFTKFLQDGRNEIPQQQRDDVQREIDKLKGRVGTLRVTTNRLEAEISVDDVPVGKAPLSEPVLVRPGRRKITATLSGFSPTTKTVEIAGLETLDVNLELGEASTLTSTPPSGETGGASTQTPAVEEKKSVLPTVMWITTGGLAAATTVTGILALSASSSQSTNLETFPTTAETLESGASKAKTMALVTDILLGATVVAAAVSVYVTVSSSSKSSPQKTGEVRLGVGPGSLSVMGTF